MLKRLLLVGLLLAFATAAFGASSVLTTKGVYYSIEKPDEDNSVMLMRRSGGAKLLILVPWTVDDVRDHDAQLEYDRTNDRLYVLWVRDLAESSDVMMAWLDSDGRWSEALLVSSALGEPAVRDELRTALTRANSDNGGRATLIHVASWVRERDALTGEYALAAFESGRNVSTTVANFQTLAERPLGNPQDDIEVTNPFPALAMSTGTDGVDLVYGDEHGTILNRLHISPRLEPNARIWKPLGRTGGTMPPSKFAAMSSEPVRAIFSRDRVVLYTQNNVFRFVVYEGGTWSPARELALDETLTADTVLSQIKRSLEEELAPEDFVTASQ